MMKFKIVLLDGTVIYANDICMYKGFRQVLCIWEAGDVIDSLELSDIRYIWVLDPDKDILIFL